MDQKLNFFEKNLNGLENALKNIKRLSNWFRIEKCDEEFNQELNKIFSSGEGKTESHVKRDPVFKENEADKNQQELKSIEEVSDTTSEENFLESVKNSNNLDTLRLKINGCIRCQLSERRNTIVFGQGNQNADLMFIGEGPGEEEDNTGLAFVGKAGKLLTQIIIAIGISRESVYIGNVVKCRPPGNRLPENDEIQKCSPILHRQIELIQPKLIVTLGNAATKSMLNTSDGIMKLRGNLFDFRGIPLIPTFHPSFLLRSPGKLDLVWDDMRMVRQILFKKD